ncbi:hypothetical protein [Mesorhizobium sp. ZC-5]|uniref:hypothetical protein n=1 Tax=Mesorhizobium sp. ZC-5 TaxID=2986066 RepID=UPI0021E89B5B|nr:hypothetical protein [Mesorhizobium sp. ZC-5]MCV3244093.1 hypothetical protein [Mesorhizobium sp. ZC-5]
MFDIERKGGPTALSELRTKALRSALGRSGTVYKVFPLKELRFNPRLANSKQVNSCANIEFPDGEDNRVAMAVPVSGAATVSEIAPASRQEKL